MQAIKFNAVFFDAGAPLYEPGRFYPADDQEAVRCVARGIAEYTDAPDGLVERKTTLGVVELAEPVDEAAVLRAQIEQQKADAVAQAAAIAAAEQQLAALEAGG